MTSKARNGAAFLNWHTLDRDASFTAIDISDVAVQETAKAAGANGIAGAYLLMNAEETAFAGSFDLDCGSSILHHLNLNKACAEIRRILRAQPFISGCGAIPEVEDFSRGEEHFAAGR